LRKFLRFFDVLDVIGAGRSPFCASNLNPWTCAKTPTPSKSSDKAIPGVESSSKTRHIEFGEVVLMLGGFKVSLDGRIETWGIYLYAIPSSVSWIRSAKFTRGKFSWIQKKDLQTCGGGGELRRTPTAVVGKKPSCQSQVGGMNYAN
jgi:hypothetical protein